jgi:hypothetical protein
MRSLLLLTLTPPKFKVVGLTSSTAPWVPVPLRIIVALPPLELRFTLPCTLPPLLGVKRRVRIWLCWACRLKGLPETRLKGAEVEALPVRVLVPVLVTEQLRSALLPTTTLPKSRAVPHTERAGPEREAPVPLRVTLAVPPLLVTFTTPPKEPELVGLKRTVTV